MGIRGRIINGGGREAFHTNESASITLDSFISCGPRITDTLKRVE